MSDQDFYIDGAEIKKLGGKFESAAADLGKHLAAFRSKTDSETIHDGFGFLTESEEITAAYIQMADKMADALTKLEHHLDNVGLRLKENAKNTDSADEALEDMFKAGKA